MDLFLLLIRILKTLWQNRLEVVEAECANYLNRFNEIIKHHSDNYTLGNVNGRNSLTSF